jgi:hypothetical protein
MAKKAAKNSRTSRAGSKKKVSRSKTADTMKYKDESSQAEAQTKTDRFLDDLSTRGEAQELDEEGNLPSDATHAIIGKDKAGRPIVRRARFKAY